MNPTNLYIVLGTACSDGTFADLLFTDPYKAALSLKLTWTDEELLALDAFVDGGLKADTKQAFADLRRKICPPTGVCPWIVPQGCSDSRAAD